MVPCILDSFTQIRYLLISLFSFAIDPAAIATSDLKYAVALFKKRYRLVKKTERIMGILDKFDS